MALRLASSSELAWMYHKLNLSLNVRMIEKRGMNREVLEGLNDLQDF